MSEFAPNFPLAELIYSNTATARGINNAPGPAERVRLARLSHALQAVRNALARPISISSGYRNPVLNRAVGGVSNSRHLVGDAVDIRLAGWDAAGVKALIDACVKAGFRGFGLGTNKAGEVTFLHVDLRTAPTVWLYNGGRVGRWTALLGRDPVGYVRSRLTRAA